MTTPQRAGVISTDNDPASMQSALTTMTPSGLQRTNFHRSGLAPNKGSELSYARAKARGIVDSRVRTHNAMITHPDLVTDLLTTEVPALRGRSSMDREEAENYHRGVQSPLRRKGPGRTGPVNVRSVAGDVARQQAPRNCLM